jgi:hypothetical protein
MNEQTIDQTKDRKTEKPTETDRQTDSQTEKERLNFSVFPESETIFSGTNVPSRNSERKD